MSNKQKDFVKKHKLNRVLVLVCQISIALLFFVIWEVLARTGLINTFITSFPTKMVSTIGNLVESNDLFKHIFVTVSETLIAFSITTVLSIVIAIVLVLFKNVAKVVEPYLTMLNSLPKIALGPILIIWIGANKMSIITMAILISIIVSIQSIYNAFENTDKNKIKLLKTFNATKYQILTKVIIPANYSSIISTLKINISMSLIGVIMGEFLTSKAGLGYLILYGTAVFNLDLVVSCIFILIIVSIVMYLIIVYIEKRLVKRH